MPGFLKATAIVCTSGAAVGAAVLAMLPPAPMDLLPTRSNFATVRASDLPPVPCKQQLWPNTDRACQTWTVARRDVEQLLSAQAATAQQTTTADGTTIVARYPVPAPPRPAADMAADLIALEATATVASDASVPSIVEQREETMAPKPGTARSPVGIAAWVGQGETAAQAKVRALAARDARAGGAGVERATAGRNAIPVMAASTGGTRRVIMIRPTSRQDELYYSARRYLAADNSAVTHR
jgi:hypothetical protein